MHYTIEGLPTNQDVANWYRTAARHWDEVLSDVDPLDRTALAEIAFAEQLWFEHNCGGDGSGRR